MSLASSGAKLIVDERKRQIMVEGWTVAHDDEHNGGEMAAAAACYAIPANYWRQAIKFQLFFKLLWPWDLRWWKPRPDDRIRELVKAGALIAAEIDRLQRLEQRKEPTP